MQTTNRQQKFGSKHAGFALNGATTDFQTPGPLPVHSDKEEAVNILLVDDQASKLVSYHAILDELGENLVDANSARQALDILLKTEVAVVLVDVCMPDLDGFELAAMIREHPRCQKTAIILVSAVLMTDDDRVRGFKHGAVDYVPVPVIPDLLRARVKVFAELYRKNRALERMNEELERRVSERTADLAVFAARLSESEERLRLALDCAEAATWDWCIESHLRDGSARYRELYGFSPDEVVTVEDWLHRVHPEDRARLVRRIEEIVKDPADNKWAEEFRISHPVKGVRWLSGIGEAVRDDSGKLERIMGLSFDITERRLAQEERASLLESERAARAEAERASHIKDQFLAMVSHELRTPLNGLLLWTELLRRNRNNPKVIDEGLEAVECSARSQVRLVEDLLDMSRIRTGRLRISMEYVDLAHLLETTSSTLMPTAEAKGIEVIRKLDAGAKGVLGDAGRLQQIMLNILSNALKFTPAGGHVWLELASTNGQLVVSVRDDGPGVAEDFLPYVFDPFRQGDPAGTRVQAGLGLGLAIARHLVELHSGTITARNNSPKPGITFVVSLPAIDEKEAKGRAGRRLAGRFDETPFASTRMLVVEDDPETSRLLKRILCDAGAEVETADSVSSALEALPRFQPDVLISDIGLPKRDGYELIRAVRHMDNAAVREVAAVAVTAFARHEDRVRAIQAGFDAYISKPLDRLKLFAILEDLLQLDRPGGQAQAVSKR